MGARYYMHVTVRISFDMTCVCSSTIAMADKIRFYKPGIVTFMMGQ